LKLDVTVSGDIFLAMASASAETHFICKACGTQFPAREKPPRSCPICEDSRQYVPFAGQEWTTLDKVRAPHRNAWALCERNLIALETTPEFAIGERALLLRTKDGNFLWDCVALLDDVTIEIIQALGGLRGIAISHPHYYTTMVEWSRAFDAAIHLHAADRAWVMRPDRAIDFWEGDHKELAPGVTLIHCGGHFDGGTVLHWSGGAEGRGALLSGDILSVMPDGCVSAMYSYPNAIPLAAPAIRRITDALEPSYDRIYGAFSGHVIAHGAKAIVAKSAQRYLRAIGG